MPTLVSPKVIYQKTEAHKALFMNRVAELISIAPQFAKASIVATLGSWNAGSVITQGSKMGLTIEPSTRQDRASLPSTVTEMFLDPNLSGEDLLQIREQVLLVQSAFSEDIYVDDVEEDALEVDED